MIFDQIFLMFYMTLQVLSGSPVHYSIHKYNFGMKTGSQGSIDLTSGPKSKREKGFAKYTELFVCTALIYNTRLLIKMPKMPLFLESTNITWFCDGANDGVQFHDNIKLPSKWFWTLLSGRLFTSFKPSLLNNSSN